MAHRARSALPRAAGTAWKFCMYYSTTRGIGHLRLLAIMASPDRSDAVAEVTRSRTPQGIGEGRIGRGSRGDRTLERVANEAPLVLGVDRCARRSHRVAAVPRVPLATGQYCHGLLPGLGLGA